MKMNTLNKKILHFITITRHKYYVGIECFKMGLYWQGIVHDLSKYLPVEFFNSAKYWTGKKTPIGTEKAEKGYSEAWLHHKGHNKHHWEYWVDWKNGKRLLCPIPEKYIKEMACDMIGASKTYGTNNPLKYFRQHSFSILMLLKDKKKLENILINYEHTR